MILIERYRGTEYWMLFKQNGGYDAAAEWYKK